MKSTTIRLLLAAALGLTVVGAQSSEGPDPFAHAQITKPSAPTASSGDAESEKEPPPVRNISLCFETFSLSLADAAALRREVTGGKETYDRVLAMVAKKTAVLETFTLLTAQPDQVVKNEGIANHIYATAYEPPELPNYVGVAVKPPGPGAKPEDGAQADPTGQPPVDADTIKTPATPSAWNTQKLGEVIAATVEGTGNGRMKLTLKCNRAELAGHHSYGQGLSEAKMPEFEERVMETVVSIPNGTPFLLGTLNRPTVSKIDKDAAGRVWLSFVTATVEKP